MSSTNESPRFDAALQAWVAYSLIRGLGGETARQLLKQFGAPNIILALPLTTLKPYFKPSAIEWLQTGENSAQLKLAGDWLTDENNHIVTLADAAYPQALLNISDPPLLLYVKGNLTLLNQASLAIVGSRHATPQGLGNATAFAESLSTAGICVISGMAHGIDAAAHNGAMNGVGSSVAVVGTGLDKVYPAANRDLAHQLAKVGALVSEFPLGTPPLAANFPRRNRIISGMSLGCLVVEASLQSGSLITARLATEQGRDVFAIPSSIHSPQSKGCHALIKQGAKLVESAQDIIEELGLPLTTFTAAASAVPDSAFLDNMGYDPVNLDTLSQRCNLTVNQLSAMLLTLELDGRVATLSGGMYQRLHT